MKKTNLFAFIAWLCAAFLLAISLNHIAIPTSAVAQQRTPLTILAASSLSTVLEEIGPLYEESQPGVWIKYNINTSGALEQAIEGGEPADVFISAASKQMDTLQAKGLIIPETRKNLLKNRIVLIVPTKGADISSFQELNDDRIKRIAIAEPKNVGAGQYAEEVLKNLGIFEKIQAKLVYANNAPEVLSFVETDEADAGIVYLTDAKDSALVKQVAAAPENSHAPIVYPIAVIKSSKNPDAAMAFINFLSGKDGRSAFEKYGFSMAE